MPVTKTASKHKSSIGVLIVSLIVSLIPLGIVALVSLKDKNVWTFPYSIYVYATIGAVLYFALYNGLIACRSRKLYQFYTVFTYIILVAAMVVSYFFRNQSQEVSFNIVAMLMFMYCVYQGTDNSDDKGTVIFRYLATPIAVLVGLIPCLWFVSVGWFGASSIAAFIVFVPCLIIAIVQIVKFHKHHLIDNALESEFEYEEATAEEIQAKLDAQDAAKGGIELSGGPDAVWRISDSTIRYLEESAVNFYNDMKKSLEDRISYTQKDVDDARFNLKYCQSLQYDDAKASLEKYIDKHNYYVNAYNNLDKKYKEIMHDIQAFANCRITSKDYGKYIIYDFLKRYDVKKSYNNKEACKVAIRTFEWRYLYKGDYFEAKATFAPLAGDMFDMTRVK